MINNEKKQQYIEIIIRLIDEKTKESKPEEVEALTALLAEMSGANSSKDWIKIAIEIAKLIGITADIYNKLDP